MIPGWLVSLCAHIPAALLVWGSFALLMMFAIGSGLATLLLVFGHPSPGKWREWLPYLPLAILRTAMGLLCMGAGSIADAVTDRASFRRLRAMDAHDAQGFCGKGIRHKDWVRFLDEMTSILSELRSSGERES